MFSYSEIVFAITVYGAVIAIPLLTAVLCPVMMTLGRESPGISGFGFACLLWFFGAPLSLSAYKGYHDWRMNRDTKEWRTAFMELCKKEAKESLLQTVRGVSSIKFEIEGEAPDRLDSYSNYIARGSNQNEYIAFDRNADLREAHVVVRYKFSKVKLPIDQSSSEVHRIDVELVESVSKETLARRTDFSSGTDSCGGGYWRNADLKLLRKAAIPLPRGQPK